MASIEVYSRARVLELLTVIVRPRLRKLSAETHGIDQLFLNLAPHEQPHQSLESQNVVGATKGEAEWQEERDVARVDRRMGETQDLEGPKVNRAVAGGQNDR